MSDLDKFVAYWKLYLESDEAQDEEANFENFMNYLVEIKNREQREQL